MKNLKGTAAAVPFYCIKEKCMLIARLSKNAYNNGSEKISFSIKYICGLTSQKTAKKYIQINVVKKENN
ncbi:MAG TPA: hypothetical protein H9675_02770 [Firmicutes bacterium]|nr:hypothetical protein [Bacillota bacterium]